MKALGKAVGKLAGPDGGDTSKGDEFWMAEMDTSELSAAKASAERAKRRQSLGEMVRHTGAAADLELQAGCSINKGAVWAIRRAYMSTKLRESKDEFVQSLPITIFCGTYNVNGKKEEDGGLAAWLSWQQNEPDIYALGFQEIVDLNAVNVAVTDSKSQQRREMWRFNIEEYLRTLKNVYTCVCQQTLVGVVLFVFVKDKYCHGQLRDVQVATARTGFRGTLGNKGGVAVRMQLFDSTLCFVSSHLAAHRGNVSGRNADFNSIVSKVAFPGDADLEWEFRGLESTPYGRMRMMRGGGGGGGGGGANSPGLDQPTFGILDHDLVFWLGDLNYRIAESVPTNEVFMRVKSPEGLEYLRAVDQLNIERSKGTAAGAFGDFTEGKLDFLPTYKYEVGCHDYDQRPEKKLRAPAWCDRVLWRVQDATSDHVQLLSYHRAELTISDHKPVAAALQAQIRCIDQERHLAAYNAVDADLSRHEAKGVNLLPQISLSTQRVDLGVVRYTQPAIASMRVANVGQSLAYIRFCPKLEEPSPSPTWLKVEPTFALLKPGDTVDVTFTARVDGWMARALAMGCAALDELLVLRLEQGPDYYLQVYGAYAQSAFGTPLSVLVSRRDRDGAGEAPVSVPVEVWRLLEGIVRRGGLSNPQVAEELFSTPGDRNEVTAASACLDSGEEFDSQCSAHSLVQVLEDLLLSLPEPVVPAKSIVAAEQECTTVGVSAWPQRFLDSLPPAHHDLFLYLMAFLREVLQARLAYVSSTSGNSGAPLSMGQLLQDQARALAVAAAAMMDRRDLDDGEPAAMDSTTTVDAAEYDYGDDFEGAPARRPVGQEALQAVIMFFLRSGLAE